MRLQVFWGTRGKLESGAVWETANLKNCRLPPLRTDQGILRTVPSEESEGSSSNENTLAPRS